MQGAEFRALTEFDENPLRFSKPICKCKSIMRIGTLTLYHTLEKTAIWTESSHFFKKLKWAEHELRSKK